MDIWTGFYIAFNVYILLLVSLLVMPNQLQFLKVAARVILKIATAAIRVILKITTALLAITILYSIPYIIPLWDGQSWKVIWIQSTGIFFMSCFYMKVFVEMKRATLPTALLDPRRRNNNKNWFFVEKLLEVGIPLVLVFAVALVGVFRLGWSFVLAGARHVQLLVDDVEDGPVAEEVSQESYSSSKEAAEGSAQFDNARVTGELRKSKRTTKKPVWMQEFSTGQKRKK